LGDEERELYLRFTQLPHIPMETFFTDEKENDLTKRRNIGQVYKRKFAKHFGLAQAA
jgi:hypothetical protein